MNSAEKEQEQAAQVYWGKAEEGKVHGIAVVYLLSTTTLNVRPWKS